MPLIRCSRCAQSYDVPAAVAVKFLSSIATCECGEFLAGSKAAVLARLAESGESSQIDLAPYKSVMSDEAGVFSPQPESPDDEQQPRSVRISARTTGSSLDQIFTISQHPLIVGRKGAHVELDNAELSIRHCSIFVRKGDIVVRDEGSHSGTFLDGEGIDEAVLSDGVHLLRVGSALLCLEATIESGLPVEPIRIAHSDLLEAPLNLRRKRPEESGPLELSIVCVEGPALGQRFPIPLEGLVVGREGSVRVDDEFLSRRHFEIHFDDQRVLRITDLGSRNGTFLNTLPARNTKVTVGDEIKAGNSCFRVQNREG